MSDADPHLPLPAGDAASPVEPAPTPEPSPAALLPDDLRVPWTWMDVLIFLIFSMGIMVVLEYSMQTVLLTTGRVQMHELSAFVSTNTVYVSVRQFLWFTLMLGFLFFTLRPRRD
ncbi:MAG: hypothetical protein HYR58_01000, partial [Acidobacteria bacterium]|nr:hypothetical protein [Acidobacteriota bacterium]